MEKYTIGPFTFSRVPRSTTTTSLGSVSSSPIDSWSSPYPHLVTVSVFRFKAGYRDTAKYAVGLLRLSDAVSSHLPTFALRIYFDVSLESQAFTIDQEGLRKQGQKKEASETHRAAAVWQTVFQRLASQKHVQLVRFEAPAFLQGPLYTSHVDLFGTLVRMLPLFGTEEDLRNVATASMASAGGGGGGGGSTTTTTTTSTSASSSSSTTSSASHLSSSSPPVHRHYNNMYNASGPIPEWVRGPTRDGGIVFCTDADYADITTEHTYLHLVQWYAEFLKEGKYPLSSPTLTHSSATASSGSNDDNDKEEEEAVADDSSANRKNGSASSSNAASSHSHPHRSYDARYHAPDLVTMCTAGSAAARHVPDAGIPPFVAYCITSAKRMPLSWYLDFFTDAQRNAGNDSFLAGRYCRDLHDPRARNYTYQKRRAAEQKSLFPFGIDEFFLTSVLKMRGIASSSSSSSSTTTTSATSGAFVPAAPAAIPRSWMYLTLPNIDMVLMKCIKLCAAAIASDPDMASNPHILRILISVAHAACEDEVEDMLQKELNLVVSNQHNVQFKSTFSLNASTLEQWRKTWPEAAGKRIAMFSPFPGRFLHASPTVGRPLSDDMKQAVTLTLDAIGAGCLPHDAGDAAVLLDNLTHLATPDGCQGIAATVYTIGSGRINVVGGKGPVTQSVLSHLRAVKGGKCIVHMPQLEGIAYSLSWKESNTAPDPIIAASMEAAAAADTGGNGSAITTNATTALTKVETVGSSGNKSTTTTIMDNAGGGGAIGAGGGGSGSGNIGTWSSASSSEGSGRSGAYREVGGRHGRSKEDGGDPEDEEVEEEKEEDGNGASSTHKRGRKGQDGLSETKRSKQSGGDGSAENTTFMSSISSSKAAVDIPLNAVAATVSSSSSYPPSTTTTSSIPPPPPPLPFGWLACVSRTHGRTFYWNTSSAFGQYNFPKA